jgi:Ca-activated chloride channel family protein
MKNISIELNADLNLLYKDRATDRILEAVITSPKRSARTDRKPLNISLVIDKSGSMHGEKLEYVKRAAAQALSVLNEDDRFSIIAFDSEIYPISESQAASESNKKAALRTIKTLASGSSTNLSGGWLRGAQQVADNKSDQSLNRVLLLTDGLANRGIQDVEELAEHASELYARGVSTSTFGVGLDYAEGLLAPMAASGGGHYYFIASPDQIPGIFAEELDELAAITATDTEVKISKPEYVSIELEGRWPAKRTKRQLKVQLGAIPANTEQTLYFKLVAPPHNKRKSFSISAKVSALDEKGEPLPGDQSKLAFKYESASVIEQAVADPVLERKAASVFVADAAVEAHKLERRRDYKAAKKLLDMALFAYGTKLTSEDFHRYQNYDGQKKSHGQF